MKFFEEYIPMVLDGTKTCTTRSERKAGFDDVFIVDGRRSQAVSVCELPLLNACDTYYAMDGFETPRQMLDALRTIYPGIKLTDSVYVHHFTEVRKR